jgi:hypothetical protein
VTQELRQLASRFASIENDQTFVETLSEAFAELGFDQFRAFEKPLAIHGLFGSHCDEAVAVRRT